MGGENGRGITTGTVHQGEWQKQGTEGGSRVGRSCARCKKEKDGYRKYNAPEAYGQSHGASPSEGDLPRERPDTLPAQDLSADHPIPEAVRTTAPSGCAVLNGHSTASPFPAMAADTSETTGHFPTLCANAPSSAMLEETSVTTQEQSGRCQQSALPSVQRAERHHAAKPSTSGGFPRINICIGLESKNESVHMYRGNNYTSV